MPTVPEYNEGQVRTQALPNARLSTDAPIEAFGGGQSASNVARAAQGVLDVGQEIFKVAKNKADNARISEAESAAIKLKTRLTYGGDNQDDEEKGFTRRQGQAAFGAPDEYNPKFEKGLSDIENSLSNDSQKLAFRQRANAMRASFSEHLTKHFAVESQQYEINTFKSGIAVSQDEAVKNYTDPVIVTNAIERQKKLTLDLAAAQGYSPNDDATKLMVSEAVSGTHSSIVGRMLANGDDMLAQKYYAANKEEVSGKAREPIEKALEESSFRGASQKASDSILAKGLGRAQAEAEVRKIEDPKLRDATMTRVRDEYTAKKQALDQYKDQLFETSFDKIRNSGGNLYAVSTLDMQAMDAVHVKTLEEYARNIKSGKNVVTDFSKYYKLDQMAADNTQAFINEDLRLYVNDLSASDLEKMSLLQRSLKKGDDSELMGVRSKQQIVTQTVSQFIDVTPKKPGGEPSVEVLEIYRRVDEELIAEQKRTGKKPDALKIQEITDRIVKPGFTDEGIFGTGFLKTKKRAYQLAPGESFKKVKYVEQMDSASKQALTAELRRRNIAITNQNLVDLYNKGRE